MFPWSNDEEAFRRWKEGTTGWPLVDANMRELRATGAPPPLPPDACTPSLLGGPAKRGADGTGVVGLSGRVPRW